MQNNHWATGDERNFFPRGDEKEFPELPCGIYDIKNSLQGPYFRLRKAQDLSELIRFSNTQVDDAVAEIRSFWTKRDLFVKHNFPFRRGILLYGPPGCHEKGTKILMYDGTQKNVEDVVVNDILMGPDSKPRKVLSLCNGLDFMYKIEPIKGDPFVVNGHHILSLRKRTSDILNISVNEYLKLSKPYRSQYKLYHSNCINEMPNKDPLRTGIKNITSLGIGSYYGFIIDQDHLYMTGDFIVHHNSGKSCAIKMIIDDVVKMNGIAVMFCDPGLFTNSMEFLREIQKTTPIVVIIEDIDSWLQSYESTITDILDGHSGFEDTVFLATTNNINIISDRIKNRPSRFDKRIYIGPPNLETRREYIANLIGKSDDFKHVKIDVWAKDSENLTFAHLKELFLSVCFFDCDYKLTLERMMEMINYEDEYSMDSSLKALAVKTSRRARIKQLDLFTKDDDDDDDNDNDAIGEAIDDIINLQPVSNSESD